MTKINLEYFGMPGTGSTVKEARLDAGRRIESFIAESGAPTLLNHRGHLLVISRDRFGWGYRFLETERLAIRTSASHCSCGMEGFDACLLAAVRHLADITRLYGERDSELFEALHNDRMRAS